MVAVWQLLRVPAQRNIGGEVELAYQGQPSGFVNKKILYKVDFEHNICDEKVADAASRGHGLSPWIFRECRIGC